MSTTFKIMRYGILILIVILFVVLIIPEKFTKVNTHHLEGYVTRANMPSIQSDRRFTKRGVDISTTVYDVNLDEFLRKPLFQNSPGLQNPQL